MGYKEGISRPIYHSMREDCTQFILFWKLLQTRYLRLVEVMHYKNYSVKVAFACMVITVSGFITGDNKFSFM